MQAAVPMCVLHCTVAVSIVLGVAANAQPARSEDIYVRCTGSIAVLFSNWTGSLESQEVTAHITREKADFYGNRNIIGRNVPVCRENADELYFDSQTCKEGGPIDSSQPREYGTFNKVTGALELTNELTNRAPAQGSFSCTRIEPVIRRR